MRSFPFHLRPTIYAELTKYKSFRANTCGIFNLEQYVTIYECCGGQRASLGVLKGMHAWKTFWFPGLLQQDISPEHIVAVCAKRVREWKQKFCQRLRNLILGIGRLGRLADLLIYLMFLILCMVWYSQNGAGRRNGREASSQLSYRLNKHSKLLTSHSSKHRFKTISKAIS